MKNIDYVDPFFGCFENDLPEPKGISAKWFFIKAQVGNCHPGAVLPFGMVSACAYTGGYSSGYGPYWVNSNARPPRIMQPDKLKAYGISHFHQSGTGFIDEFYNFFIVTAVNGKMSNAKELFDLTDEKAEPGFYSCKIGDVGCELTVTQKGAIEKFSFSEKTNYIIIDPSLNGIVKNGESFAKDGKTKNIYIHKHGLDFTIDYSIRLFASVHCNKAKNIEILEDGRVAITIDSDEATIYIGFSFNSIENAQKNCTKACENGFSKARHNAFKQWEKRLDAITIKADEKTKRIFYSCLYQSLIKPIIIDEDSPHERNGTQISMCDFSTMWDIYKTELPLLFLLYDDVSNKIVKAFDECFHVFGYIPVCTMLTKPDNKNDMQARALACVSLYDAHSRGVKGIDKNQMLKIMVAEFDRDIYDKFKAVGVVDDYPSHTIDAICACYSIYLLANELGEIEIADRFLKYSKNWRNAYSPLTGLCHEDGEFYEGSHWNYSFRLHPFIDERISLCNDFEKTLNDFFGYTKDDAVQFLDTKDMSLLRSGEARNVFEGFNNETDMETPYIYNYIGRLDKTAEIIRAGTKYMYSTGKGGLPGNNDSGGLSSLFVTNALGIFPVSGQDVFLIGSPCIDEATIYLRNGNVFKVITENNNDNNIYPKEIYLNNQKLDRLYLSNEEIMQGGVLKFVMSNCPTKF